VEHVTFLGSKKRESLLGTGARANAYTDFHHTVFHVHAPLVNGITGAPMLPQARAVDCQRARRVGMWLRLRWVCACGLRKRTRLGGCGDGAALLLAVH
jgi:hypothetical protein